uniref:Uncharacterized protein n=1 Tax=Knipowitschia caucasica TaxID=637954 RepID=A0AAV2M362_KNICA
MLQWSGTRILRPHELDAFLAQAVSPERHDPEQDLETEALDARGLQLASVLMSGVDTAMFANDACGRPVPWEHCCPWMFFDGKLFQSKIIRSKQGRGQLLSLCDGQTELTAKVEMMRQSILEGPVLPPSGPVLPPSVPVLPPSVPVLPPSGPVLPPSGPVLPPSGPVLPPSGPVLPPSALCFLHQSLCFLHQALCFLHQALCFLHQALCFLHQALCFLHQALCFLHQSLWSQRGFMNTTSNEVGE